MYSWTDVRTAGASRIPASIQSPLFRDTIVAQVDGNDAGIEAGAYRARAGTLTLMYLGTSIKRDVVRAVLAQAATGALLVDPEELTEPDDEQTAIAEAFADPYLVEPVDPTDDPDDPDTEMRPTPAFRKAPFVGAVLQNWLNSCPRGPIDRHEPPGVALWPLLSGWASTVVHALAAGPLTMAALQEEIGVLDDEAVIMRVSLLEAAGLLRFLPTEVGEEMLIGVTEWLRLGVGPIAAAAQLELRHPPGDTAPIAAADVEAALRLALPLLRLDPSVSGACSMQVELDEGVVGGAVAMTARIEEGRVVACEPGADPEARAWMAGSTAAWLDAVIDCDAAHMRGEGDRSLAELILRELRRALFEAPA